MFTKQIRELAQDIADNCYDAKLILKNAAEILELLAPANSQPKKTPIITKEQIDILNMLYNINLRYLAKNSINGTYAYERRPILTSGSWTNASQAGYMFGCSIDAVADLVPDDKTVVSIKELLDTASVKE